MANEKYFLQMSECKWPDHIFISRKKTFKICIYHSDPKKQHPSLYCLSNDHEAYPISIELLNSKNKIINVNKKLWTIISASTDFKIKHSYCEFAIKFDSLPHHFDQPLKFRFKASSNNSKIPHIEPFITRPFRVVRYQLRILEEPPETFYKDDGGMRNNHMTIKVALINPLIGNGKKHKMNVPLKCKLITEDGKEINGTMKKKGHHNHDDIADDENINNQNDNHSTPITTKRNKQKQRPPLHYLQLHEDCSSPKISSVSGECIVKFRINDVSQNHKNQGFHVVIQPNVQKQPNLCEVYECQSSKIIVKSKSPEKLNAQNSSKKRRSTRSRSKKKVSYKESTYSDDNNEYQHNGHHHNTRSKSKSGRAHKKRKRSKSKRSKHHKDNANDNGDDDDDEYKPQNTDNSDLDIDMLSHNDINNEYDGSINNSPYQKIKIETGEDVHNNYRKRRKINGTKYVKTNGGESPMKRPKTFNVAPNKYWFPSIHHSNITKNGTNGEESNDKALNNNHLNNNIGPEAELQLFAQSCFNMLQFREWVCIGYQTKYIDKASKPDKLQIVRCLLCDSEGVWTHHKPPRHKKGCDFVKLKRSFYQIQQQFTNLSTSPKHKTLSNHKATNSNNNGIPMPFTNNRTMHPPPIPPPHSHLSPHPNSGHHHHHHHTTIISPPKPHLPPIPQPGHNHFMPPPFAMYGPPIGPFPFPAPNPYHIISNQPPPLIHASSSNAAHDHPKTIKTQNESSNNNHVKDHHDNNDKNKTKNGKTKIKTQQLSNDNIAISKEKENGNHNKSSPLLFPFGHQSPQMFPTSVGPMQSPLFSINNVPQTPQMFSQPLSANGANHSNNMFLPAPNPNAAIHTNHHSSMNEKTNNNGNNGNNGNKNSNNNLSNDNNNGTDGGGINGNSDNGNNTNHSNNHKHSSLSSYGHTASTLPMPLSLPMSSVISPNISHFTNDTSKTKNLSASTNPDKNNRDEDDMNKSQNDNASPTPHSRAQSINPPMSTITAMSGITQDPPLNPSEHDIGITNNDNDENNIDHNIDNNGSNNHSPHHQNNTIDHNNSNMSITATAGDTMTCRSNPAHSTENMVNHSNGNNENHNINNNRNNNNSNHDENRLILDNMPSFHSSRASSICNTAAATMGSPTATLRSNPPQSKSGTNASSPCTSSSSSSSCAATPTPPNTNTSTPNNDNSPSHHHHHHTHHHHHHHKNNNGHIAISVDSGISRLSQSASLSAVATAGGLTVNTPLPSVASVGASQSVSINTNATATSSSSSSSPPTASKNDRNSKNPTSQMIAAHAPPPLIPSRYNGLSLPTPTNHLAPLSLHAANIMHEAQINSMPPLHPDTNPSSPTSHKSNSNEEDEDKNSKPPPLHQRRLMENAPTTLSIPSVTTTTSTFSNMT